MDAELGYVGKIVGTDPAAVNAILAAGAGMLMV